MLKEFVRLRAKAYSYLMNNNDKDQKAKDTKKWVIKRKLKSKDHKNCLKAAQIENKINHLEETEINVDRF